MSLGVGKKRLGHQRQLTSALEFDARLPGLSWGRGRDAGADQNPAALVTKPTTVPAIPGLPDAPGGELFMSTRRSNPPPSRRPQDQREHERWVIARPLTGPRSSCTGIWNWGRRWVRTCRGLLERGEVQRLLLMNSVDRSALRAGLGHARASSIVVWPLATLVMPSDRGGSPLPRSMQEAAELRRRWGCGR